MAPSTVGLILALALFTSSPSTCVHVQAFMQVAPSAALFAPSCNAQAHLSLALPSSSSSSSAEAEGVSFGGNDWQDGRCNVSIVYCTGCRWMLRSAYYAQELLTTFPDDLSSVTLIPSRPPLPGGMLIITLDGETIWNRKEQGQFPETKELKQLIRDVVAPERSLGHSDNIADDTSDEKSSVDKCDECDEAKAIMGPIPGDDDAPSPFDDMDDDEAAEMRRLFGVM